ncbi:MAG TPA: response regulator [Pyrinomonadaceae bacterium]|nr:response regulator [Pyrinomonadaceae bacterium]
MTAAPAPARSVPTVLVIEDYADTRELVSSLLRKHGYDVIEAEDGVEGLLKATGSYPDLVILDLVLPEMDGVETARRIHEMPKLSRIPIFVMSAILTKEVEAAARAAGCTEVFAKPFEVEELIGKVRTAVGGTRP